MIQAEQLVALRPTQLADIDFVLSLEQHPENRPFIGQWSREEHTDALARPDREHWIIERKPDHARLGYIIAYNLTQEGLGVFVKRIVVADKSRGTGRTALYLLVEHAFRDLNADQVSLAVFASNERGQRAYRALGFVDAALTETELSELQGAVGAFPDGVLVMTVWPNTLRALAPC